MGEVPGAKYNMYDIVFIKDMIQFSNYVVYFYKMLL